MDSSSTVRLIYRVPYFDNDESPHHTSFGISGRFQPLSQSRRQIIHVLLTLPPLSCSKLQLRSTCMPHPRRQHSIWTRIKFSIMILFFDFKLVQTLRFVLSQAFVLSLLLFYCQNISRAFRSFFLLSPVLWLKTFTNIALSLYLSQGVFRVFFFFFFKPS